jgi:predicted MFS family arabinose efflux permease
MVIRFVAGLGTAMVWPHLGSHAARLAPEGLQGRAVAIASAGTPLGIPLGTPVGGIGDWQLAFYAAAGLAGLTMLATLPNMPGLPTDDRFKPTNSPAWPPSSSTPTASRNH